MIRALLDGRKTQTRRIVKTQGVNIIPFIGADDKPMWKYGLCLTHDRVINQHIFCPYGKPGNLLWVRESWGYNPDFPGQSHAICYRADPEHKYDVIKWKPSIHLTRRASRLTLRITDVRVQRLQGISADDCIEEGINISEIPGIGSDGSIIAAYRKLWESINGPESWDSNPWVWCVSFEVIKANVDAVLAQKVAA